MPPIGTQVPNDGGQPYYEVQASETLMVKAIAVFLGSLSYKWEVKKRAAQVARRAATQENLRRANEEVRCTQENLYKLQLPKAAEEVGLRSPLDKPEPGALDP